MTHHARSDSSPALPPLSHAATTISRRSLMRAGGLAALGAWIGIGGASTARAASPAGALQPATRARALRFAHLSDLHIQPEKRATEGVAACLNHLSTHDAKPELIVTGGDLIMDGFGRDEARTRLQFELLTKTLADHAPCPVAHTLGNHDIWGWDKAKSKTTGTESRWGKAWALEQLKMSKPYHAFDRGGWRFIVLDSVRPKDDDGYIAYLDDAQLAWLTAELQQTPASTPIVVVSHISIFAASPILDSDPKVPLEAKHGVIHRDAAALHRLFRAHGNVRLALSGHMHRNDRTEIDGVTYICDGAVSGSWWKGRKAQCDEGYGLIDLYSDGTFDHRYVKYGWEVSPEDAK